MLNKGLALGTIQYQLNPYMCKITQHHDMYNRRPQVKIKNQKQGKEPAV